MKCYNCGSFLYESDYCSVCGSDVTVYRKLVKRSNLLYNKALGYAQSRNLTGAIDCLKASLKAYKGNVNARNLLGLVYYETGEFSQALVHWILSKNLQPEDNLAGYFLEIIQKNQSGMEEIASSIRKYNKSLDYIHQNSYDLAEIQLKKLLNEYPNLVRGHQLLALLLMRKKKYADAKVALKKAEKIDAGNPVTISYLNFLNIENKKEERNMSALEVRNKRKQEKKLEEHTPLSGDDVIIPKSSYREYNPTTMAIIQIAIGIVVGAAIIFFIVTPAKTRSLRGQAATQAASYESQIEDLNNQIEELKSQIGDTTASQRLINCDHLNKALVCHQEGDDITAAQELIAITHLDYMDSSFATLYSDLYSEVINAAVTSLETAVEGTDYNSIVTGLTESLTENPDNEPGLYMLGLAYQNAGNKENALSTFNDFLAKFPNSGYKESVTKRIDELNGNTYEWYYEETTAAETAAPETETTEAATENAEAAPAEN